MSQAIEKSRDVLESLMADVRKPASFGYAQGEQSDVSRLLALMHQASKTQYIIRTIPACNSDE